MEKHGIMLSTQKIHRGTQTTRRGAQADTQYKYTHQVIRKWHTGGETAGTNGHNETQTYKVKQETHRLFYTTNWGHEQNTEERHSYNFASFTSCLSWELGITSLNYSFVDDLQSHHEDQSHPSCVSVYTDTLDSRIFCYQLSKLYSREQYDIYSNFRLFTLSLWSYKQHNNILPNIRFSYSRSIRYKKYRSIWHNSLTLPTWKGSEDLAYCHSVGYHGFDGACGISPSCVPAVRP
ncbi:uncharacterized protein LOC116326961 isoform X2 [Oreochromis aureus]|uniref:uncharacterized protein LOC116326961 isoform X2 n=1 Tax=Oreochromis aureus TaxID=47969 RepID=UPI001952B034|nr:uncharacterized protein LOC116326961 isoform X2 [Oreochromis aureus]